MTEDLPTAVRAYFDGKNARDFDAAVAAFLPDAVVRDEVRTYRDGMRSGLGWRRRLRSPDRTAVRRFDRQDGALLVVAEVSGTFPGSPADIRFRFVLDGDRIAGLEAGA